ncbi:MAG: AbrB/MazE/SpoVT family DNA-binding domain-containing protein, partial [Deltaproteobacteria bacterium]|nr:AbrB/MazE/SpoVT family DNA-binding domain-containing protein [Deltaproteobacteria bacterium]
QITIPTEIRQKAHIEEGDIVDVEYEDNRIVIIPKRVTDKSVNWTKRFDEALLHVRTAAKKAGINNKDVGIAVRAARKRTAH